MSGGGGESSLCLSWISALLCGKFPNTRTVRERCNAAGSEDGGQAPRAKECGRPQAAGKDKEMPSPLEVPGMQAAPRPLAGLLPTEL